MCSEASSTKPGYCSVELVVRLDWASARVQLGLNGLCGPVELLLWLLGCLFLTMYPGLADLAAGMYDSKPDSYG